MLNKNIFKVSCGGSDGTAFLISDKLALTAFHVVKKYNSENIFVESSNGKKIEAKLSKMITEEYKEKDIALLELPKVSEDIEPLKLVSAETIVPNTRWTSKGFPMSKENYGDTVLESPLNIVNQQLSELANGKYDLELEHSRKLNSYAGYSGAPLFIDGDVVGVINHELLERDESKELTALSIKHIEELLHCNNVDFIQRNHLCNNKVKIEFNKDKIEEYSKDRIKDLGVRYSPDLNVELPIISYFNSVCNNEEYATKHLLILGKYLGFINKIKKNININQDFEFISEEIDSVSEILNEVRISISNKLSLGDYVSNINESVHHLINKINSAESILIDLENLLEESEKFITTLYSDEVRINSERLLILRGEAGVGKSHLLADVVNRELDSGATALFLLGQHFNERTPVWNQILDKNLNLDCNPEDLLDALNDIGEKSKKRTLFVIDAINEGQGKYFWKDHLSSFISLFKSRPWVSLIISIRESYWGAIIPTELELDKVSVYHKGFVGAEHTATKLFFQNYNIEYPKIPLTHQEFSNPLFLKLFCEGLKLKGLTYIPKGYRGFSNVIDYLISNIEEKLSNKYSYNKSAKLVEKILFGIVDYKLSKKQSSISYDEMLKVTNNITIGISSTNGIIDDVIDEGLLSKNVIKSEDLFSEYDEIVYFSYERLDDYFTAQSIIRNLKTYENPDKVFMSGGELEFIISNSYLYQGVIESLSMLLPEVLDIEFFDLLDKDKRNEQTIVEAFINSLHWRNISSITAKTDNFIKEEVLIYKYSVKKFIENSFYLAGVEEHPYNIDFLHSKLIKIPLPKRDALWIPIVEDLKFEHSSIRNLVDWVMNTNLHIYLSDDAKLLTSTAISWLLTSTNIELRDLATKSLTKILVDEMELSKKLLIKFECIDDPYVLERILSSIYGASIKSSNIKGLNELALYIVDLIFKCDEVYPNVLVRDYARNIVEFSIFKNVFVLDDINLIRPPYLSSLPTDFPSNGEVDSLKFDYQDEGVKPYQFSQNAILSSMITEYGRGICSYGDFGRYVFQSSFSLWSDKEIDVNDLSNWACKLIFEKFGYDVELHGKFDRTIGINSDRFNNFSERIGKKYQWLSLYEVAARVADNVGVEGGEHSYQGPWQLGLRNIDPSFIRAGNKRNLVPKVSKPSVSLDWDMPNNNWLTEPNDLPDPKKLIAEGCERFLKLQTNYNWKEPLPFGVLESSHKPKVLWYQIRSYFVKEEDFDIIYDWLKKQDLMGRWMPECNDNYTVFSREYYWSPAYLQINDDVELWKEVIERKNYISNTIGVVIPSVESHVWEGQEDSNYFSPRKIMFDSLPLQYTDLQGVWADFNDEVVCFDRAAEFGEQSQLFIREDILMNFLNENKLKIIWTVLGEKQISNPNFNYRDVPKSWLDISGIYTIIDGVVSGSYTTRVKPV
ncbi:serine protease [Photobacterium kishitanii]|uniref:Uncharacterized protein n=1 Tax=Photobacterium kishitanii TaxID=318456 RepID=A0A2T3KDZ3_9GAMM|nr:serine protease [Photobacterium kishitanii]PSU95076.1 hypothetical protein C9J27_18945 [Photobacterium kishitanii]